MQLKAGRSGPIVFMIPGFGGSIDRFVMLGSRLDTPMPVYGIQACGVDGSSEPDTDVEQMVKRYLRLMGSLQPCGPYMLIGHSFGGTVAFEMARQIRAAGEQVGCLIVLDSNFAERLWPRQYFLRIMVKRLTGRVEEFLSTPPHYRTLYVSHLLDIAARKLHLAPQAIPQERPAAMFAHQIAFTQYTPAFYDGKMIFFRATCEDYPADPEPLWRRRTRALEIHSAAGGHLGMLDPEHVPTLAPKISACLLAATAG